MIEEYNWFESQVSELSTRSYGFNDVEKERKREGEYTSVAIHFSSWLFGQCIFRTK